MKSNGKANLTKSSTYWFGLTTLMLPLHMGEQLVFGIDELAKLRLIGAVYYGWFERPDYGTVTLVAVLGTLILGLIYAVLMGGAWRRVAIGILNLAAIGEVHHIIETVSAGRYMPGTVTAIPYFTFGILLMRALILEGKEERGRAIAPRLAAA